MNIELCKQCDKIKNKNTTIFLHEDNNEFTPVIANTDLLFNNWICQMKTVDQKNIKIIDVNGNQVPYVDFKDVEVHNDCPYYIEHKLNDWNIE